MEEILMTNIRNELKDRIDLSRYKCRREKEVVQAHHDGFEEGIRHAIDVYEDALKEIG